jgi:hypothetical protein
MIYFEFVVMTGRQAINLIGQLLKATGKTICGACGKCCKTSTFETQWEIDNELNDFDSNTLFSEYLDIGMIAIISISIALFVYFSYSIWICHIVCSSLPVS